jgi:hypothetical protein
MFLQDASLRDSKYILNWTYTANVHFITVPFSLKFCENKSPFNFSNFY